MKDRCQDAISFMTARGLSVNSYVSGLRKETWVPVLYLAAMSDKREVLVRHLIVHGADVLLKPDGDAPPILLTCHTKFLQFFISRGARVDDAKFIRDALVHGEGARIRALMRRNIISKAMLQAVGHLAGGWEGIILSGLKLALSYLFYLYASSDGQKNKEITDLTFKKYVDVAWLALECGWEPGEQVLNLCVDYYLYEMLENLRPPPGLTPVIYHTQMDRSLVAMYRPLLNDRRYEETCRVTGQAVDPELYITDICR